MFIPNTYDLTWSYDVQMQTMRKGLDTQYQFRFISLSSDSGWLTSDFGLNKIQLSCAAVECLCLHPESCHCLLICRFPLVVASFNLVHSNLPFALPTNLENVLNFIPGKAIRYTFYVKSLRNCSCAAIKSYPKYMGTKFYAICSFCCFVFNCCITYPHK